MQSNFKTLGKNYHRQDGIAKVTIGRTFDDGLLRHSNSELHPNFVDVSTRRTRDIRLNMPLLSEAMDTVTEARLAIAMAQQGGMGIIHKNMSIEQQAEEVDKVKRSEAGMIVDPVTMRPWQSIAEALQVMEKYKISGVPVTDQRVDHHRVQHGTARGYHVDRVDQLVQLGDPVLEEIAAPAGTPINQGEGVARVGVLGQHHHRGPRMRRSQRGGESDALIRLRRRHPHISDHHVRVELTHQVQSRVIVDGQPHHPHPSIG